MTGLILIYGVAMKRSIKSEATRQHILDTSFELLLRKSFVGVGLQEILKACDVPKGSFYHYFASKEAFGCALLEQYMADYKVQVEQLWQHTEQSAYARLKAFGNSLEKAQLTKVLAQNQGLYNGFLAAGLFWALIAPETYAVALANFFLVCVLIAGIYGALTASKKNYLYPICTRIACLNCG